ncbi:hypothetical protein HMI54_014972 [Coelomomyces lativittatus]|nr:hypothetical protein HMI56_006924 [Coelomomyces lativittatus]KAJ1513487.1 hypothetical protein HMI54_014972 [Coelomomyces lativittatus]KAJ1517054.1 hypothetical protein HMI55_000749 [Coelomomyces lativittatus]
MNASSTSSLPLSSSSLVDFEACSLGALEDTINVHVQFQPTSSLCRSPTPVTLSSANQDDRTSPPGMSASSTHTYVLSRFLLSRYLTAIQIQKEHAMQIAFLVKQTLVNQHPRLSTPLTGPSTSESGSDLDTEVSPPTWVVVVTQADFEHVLFQWMIQYGYSSMDCGRFQFMQRWHQRRRPLLILLAGTKGLHKSLVAQTLAERLHISNVVKTEVVAELMRSMMHATPPSTSFSSSTLTRMPDESCWATLDLSSSTTHTQALFLKAYELECRWVQWGLVHDMDKCFKEGRSMIIVGPHLDRTLIQSIYEQWWNLTSSTSSTTRSMRLGSRPFQEEDLDLDLEEGLLVPFLLTTHEPLVNKKEPCCCHSPSNQPTPPLTSTCSHHLHTFYSYCDLLQSHLLQEYSSPKSMDTTSFPLPSHKPPRTTPWSPTSLSEYVSTQVKPFPFDLFHQPEQSLQDMHAWVLTLMEQSSVHASSKEKK